MTLLFENLLELFRGKMKKPSELFEGTNSNLYKTWKKATAKSAKIIKDDGLWLVIDGDEGTAWAIEEDEVLPILMACTDWLSKRQSAPQTPSAPDSRRA